jgi:response regulator NasT
LSAFHILLVDDDRLVLATLEKGLENAGYLVTTAESGDQALQQAAEKPFDLAILDICMPGQSGIETARILRERFDIPGLFLSAYNEEDTVQQAVMGGGLGYVVKPVDAPQLIPAVESALARARDLRALIDTKKQLEQALSGQRKNSVAVGILMERRGLAEAEAFETLRATARSSNRKLDELSRELVDALERVNTL